MNLIDIISLKIDNVEFTRKMEKCNYYLSDCNNKNLEFLNEDNNSNQNNETDNKQEVLPQDKPLYEKIIAPVAIGGVVLLGIGLVFKKRY